MIVELSTPIFYDDKTILFLRLQQQIVFAAVQILRTFKGPKAKQSDTTGPGRNQRRDRERQGTPGANRRAGELRQQGTGKRSESKAASSNRAKRVRFGEYQKQVNGKAIKRPGTGKGTKEYN